MAKETKNDKAEAKAKAEAAEEAAEEKFEDPEAEGWAIYDHAARTLDHVFYGPAGAEEEDARRQFARAHRHSGDHAPRLSLVWFEEVSDSADVYENPDDWEFEDVPEVDRRT